MFERALAGLVLLLSLLALLASPRPAVASPGFTEQCESALPKEQIDDLIAAMRTVESSCTLERVDTHTFRTLIEWRAGERSLTVLLGPRACVVEPSQLGTELAFHAPEQLEHECPAVLAAVQKFVGEPREITELTHVRTQSWSGEPERWSFADPRIAAGLAWIAVLALVAIGSWRRGWHRAWPLAATERPWARLIAAGLLLGLLARFMVEPSIANWYGAFLPAQGWGELRFGASAAILQASVRAIGPWTVELAHGLFRTIGALAVPLTIVLVRRLGGSLVGAALAGIVVALEPIPVRVSASSAEHGLAATLALAAWVTWMRTAVDPSARTRMLAMLLVWLAALTRVDCLPQLALIPLWTTLYAGAGWRPLAQRLADAGWYLACLAAISVHAWFAIIVPSNHPGPTREGIVATIELFFAQFWIAAIEPPYWITPTCLAIVVLGLLTTLVHKRWRTLAAILLSAALVFVPLGRNLSHDGLTGARYFVLLMPLLAVSASMLAAGLGNHLAAPRRLLAGIGLAGFTALELFTVQPAWRHEYTFQAEYRFLARALGEHAGQLDGCTLWFVRPRQGLAEADIDCCLWPSESPLRLLAPELRFRSVPSERELDDEQGCHLYYQGSVCELDPALVPLSPRTVEGILAQCERLRERAGERELASESVTEQTLEPRFRARPSLWLRGRGLAAETDQ